MHRPAGGKPRVGFLRSIIFRLWPVLSKNHPETSMSSLRIRCENLLGQTAPRIYMLLRRCVRWVKGLLGRQSYAESRKDFNYYREVLRLVRLYVPDGESVIDVGSGETRVIDELAEFSHRVALDQRYVPPRPGIAQITADFRVWRPPCRYDLVLCLQVLEHLNDPTAFAQKLFSIGEWVIITVPYGWPAGACPGHVQDPVDEAKLRGWTGREPLETVIVSDGRNRLIAVYRPDPPDAQRAGGDPVAASAGGQGARHRDGSPALT